MTSTAPRLGPRSPARRVAVFALALSLALSLAVALTLGVAGRAEARESATDGPAIWRLADADTEVFLFGSVHALPPNVPWRSSALESALDRAAVVYFEAPTDPLAQIQVQAVLIELGFLPPSQSLSDFLSPETRAALVAVAADLDVDAATLERTRPWLAFNFLTAATLERAGAAVDNGVEVRLGLAARRAEKEIRHFETLEEQLRFLAGMSPELQIDVLELTLEDYPTAVETMERMVDAWSRGALEDLGAEVFQSVDKLPQEFFETLFSRRNAAWAATIDELMRDEATTALIVVGAGHLIGRDSLVELLRARGYEVERL